MEANKINSTVKIDFQVTLKLNEQEARALEAIAGYGSSEFLKCFYEHLGKHYLQPNESGVISLFSTIRNEIPKHISKLEKCRKQLNNESCKIENIDLEYNPSKKVSSLK
ncbi:MAG: Caulobacter phage Cr30 [Bacteroidota bacterium]|jgi:hypothetical protein